MASLDPKPFGYNVRFGKRSRQVDNRKTVRLNDVSETEAKAAAIHIQHLYDMQQLDTPIDIKTQRWLAKIPGELHKRIASQGLCEPRMEHGGDWFKDQTPELQQRLIDHQLREAARRFSLPCQTVVELTNHFLVWKIRDEMEDSTIEAYRKSVRLMLSFFRPSRQLASITKRDIDDLISWVYRSGRYCKTRRKFTGKPLAKTTASRRVRTIKGMFRRAADARWIDPGEYHFMFVDAPKQTRTNPDRQYEVPAEVCLRVIEHGALDNEQRLIFALARWCACRIPSELLPITWDCVDWESEKILLRAPKQKKHEWKHERWTPIWPEVRKYLDIQYFDDHQETTNVIRRYRSGGRTQHRSLFVRACERAGVTESRDEKPWEKLWINQRSTRETELRLMGHPADVVNYWLNHNEDVSRAHYQQRAQWEKYDWRAVGAS